MSEPRPTRIQGGVGRYKSAVAIADSECPSCGKAVEENEPIFLIGVSFIEGPRPRKVDLSDAEWVCTACFNEYKVPPT